MLLRSEALGEDVREHVVGATRYDFDISSFNFFSARKIFADHRVEFPFPLPVLEDNMGAIALTTGPTPHHQRTKHIGYRFHYVCSLVQQGILRFQHQDTAEQPADLFTKFLTEAVFTKHAEVILGIKQLKIVQKPLPRSTRIYLELHNQQLEQTKQA